MGVRPSTYLTEWSDRDRGLTEGLLYLEGSTGSHGLPSWIAKDTELDFNIIESQDRAAAALEEVQEEYSRGNPMKGLRLSVVPAIRPNVTHEDLPPDFLANS